IDAEANATAVLGQMLYGEPQSPRPRRTEHQPIGPQRKVFLGQRVAKQRVIDAKILAGDPALRNARGAASFEYVDRLPRKAFGNPAADRTPAKPLIFERGKLFEVVERANLAQRIEFQLLLKF